MPSNEKPDNSTSVSPMFFNSMNSNAFPPCGLYMSSVIRIGGLPSPAMNEASVNALHVLPLSERALTWVPVERDSPPALSYGLAAAERVPVKRVRGSVPSVV